MKIKDFLAMMETPLNSVDIDLYFGDKWKDSITISADELMKSKYADREMLGFDLIDYGMSITTNKKLEDK